MLLHGVAARYGREQLAAFDSVAVHTLAADASTNKTNHVLTSVTTGNDVPVAVAAVTQERWRWALALQG
jgi:hypothetical protein